MSSHNIDQNAMLKYVCFCFDVWGISFVNKQILKKAKQNSSEAYQPMTNLLFQLCMLEIVDFNYTYQELGIKLQYENSEIFIQQFVLAYFSQANCPILYTNQSQHGLDFCQSRVLLLIVGWFMAKIQFFSQLKSKYIHRKFNDLYIDRKQSKQPTKNKPGRALQKNNERHNEPSLQLIQRQFRKLNNQTFKIQCLERKKSQIMSRLSKQLSQFNKKNQTSYKIGNILNQSEVNVQEIQKQQDQLQIVLNELIKGMKYQQYFWVWMQMKVIDSQFKYLENQYADDFQRVDGIKDREWVSFNTNYLSMYNKQYNNMVKRMEQVNQYMNSIEDELSSVKTPKNEASIQKQVNHDCQKILRSQNKQILQRIGTPCFLKLQAIKYCEKHGFGARTKKTKKKNEKVPQASLQNQTQLKNQIQDFIGHLQQIKFI